MNKIKPYLLLARMSYGYMNKAFLCATDKKYDNNSVYSFADYAVSYLKDAYRTYLTTEIYNENPIFQKFFDKSTFFIKELVMCTSSNSSYIECEGLLNDIEDLYKSLEIKITD